jgi:hypothetical protein
VSGVASQLIPEELLWTPPRNRIYVPHPAQVAFFNRPLTVQEKLWPGGVPYHVSDATVGTWLGVTRSVQPLDWKGLLDKLTINPKEGLYVIDESTVGRNVEKRKESGRPFNTDNE